MIYTLGETVLDIIIKDIDEVNVRPGGSMLNTAISLGRFGLNVSHISAMAKDEASAMLMDFLKQNGVGTSYIFRDNAIKTSLALAFLDDENNANYSFYKDKLSQNPQLKFPKVKEGDVIHFGSFFSLNHHIRGQLKTFLLEAKNAGAFIFYDPNFRKPHQHQLKQLLPYIEENFMLADVVKASADDLEIIYGISNLETAWQTVQRFNVDALVYTQGEKGSSFINEEYKLSVPALETPVLSTIGAGDTYSAGIIYYLKRVLNAKTKRIELEKDQAKSMLNLASSFSAEVCSSYDNYLSDTFVKNFVHV